MNYFMTCIYRLQSLFCHPYGNYIRCDEKNTGVERTFLPSKLIVATIQLIVVNRRYHQ